MTPGNSDRSEEAQIRKLFGLSTPELKLTAILYTRMGALKLLKETSKLPDKIGGLWNVIPMRIIIEERGPDPTLTPDELLVYEAIIREGRLPGGAIHSVDRDHSD